MFSIIQCDKELGYENISLMRSLAKKNIENYHEFGDSLNTCPNLLPLFEDFILRIGDDKRKEIIKKCNWMASIIRFETNQLYRHWYGREFIQLKDDYEFIEYLKSNHDLVPYLRRLNKINIPLRRRIREAILGLRYNFYSMEQ